MKHLTQHAAALLMFVVLSSISVPAQEKSRGDVRSRDIELAYDEGRADGLRIAIKKIVEVPVLSTEEFAPGDEVRVAFESNFEGFVYILNLTPTGKTLLLFPNPDNRDNKIHLRQQVKLGLKFTKDKGVEVLQVYMSREPILLFDNTLKAAIAQGAAKVFLDESAKRASQEIARDTLKGASNASQGEGIKDNSLAAQGGQNGFRSRGVYYDSGEDNAKKESTIAVEQDTGDGHLKNGDVAFYEIRLKHR
ncbi:MAG: DUF4384 domain-containing protein [Blastocatellia bacterium]